MQDASWVTATKTTACTNADEVRLAINLHGRCSKLYWIVYMQLKCLVTCSEICCCGRRCYCCCRAQIASPTTCAMHMTAAATGRVAQPAPVRCQRGSSSRHPLLQVMAASWAGALHWRWCCGNGARCVLGASSAASCASGRSWVTHPSPPPLPPLRITAAACGHTCGSSSVLDHRNGSPLNGARSCPIRQSF